MMAKGLEMLYILLACFLSASLHPQWCAQARSLYLLSAKVQFPVWLGVRAYPGVSPVLRPPHGLATGRRNARLSSVSRWQTVRSFGPVVVQVFYFAFRV